MQLSVVVPTLNARDDLAGCLDALSSTAPDAELIVVNGPSADGTTGMVQERTDVDALVEIADRPVNAARNAGLARATGEQIAFVSHRLIVDDGWRDAVAAGLTEAAAVSGPEQTEMRAGVETEKRESRTIAGREVQYLTAGNLAFRRGPLEALDGFDEYLSVGGARDIAHRMAGMGFDVTWKPDMSVRREVGADGGMRETDWAWKYRSLAYRLVKNYGLRPTVFRRLLSHAGRDAYEGLQAVRGGDLTPSAWLGTGRAVLTNLGIGCKDGLLMRRRDRTARRNPQGCSARGDRAVTVYDWRDR